MRVFDAMGRGKIVSILLPPERSSQKEVQEKILFLLPSRGRLWNKGSHLPLVVGTKTNLVMI